MALVRRSSAVKAFALSASISLFPSMSPAQESVADGQGQESKKPKLTEKQKIIAARIMDEDPQMRKAAVEEYGDQKDKDALPFIMSSTMDDDADVRRAACLALMKMKEPKAMDALAARLKDEDEGVRYWAAKALGESGDPRAVDPLIQSMKKEQDPKARAIMAEGLGDLKGQKAVAALAERLKPALEREADVRMAAVEALGKIGGAEAQSVLKVAAAKDPDEWVRKKAAYALTVKPAAPVNGQQDE